MCHRQRAKCADGAFSPTRPTECAGWRSGRLGVHALPHMAVGGGVVSWPLSKNPAAHAGGSGAGLVALSRLTCRPGPARFGVRCQGSRGLHSGRSTGHRELRWLSCLRLDAKSSPATIAVSRVTGRSYVPPSKWPRSLFATPHPSPRTQPQGLRPLPRQKLSNSRPLAVDTPVWLTRGCVRSPNETRTTCVRLLRRGQSERNGSVTLDGRWQRS